MQIIELDLDDWNLFCPLTGQKVYTEDGQANAPTLRGGWCDEVPDEPVYLAEELKPLWQKYLAAQEAAEDLLDIPAFLRSVDLLNWVAFELRIGSMACGPVWSREWTVLELNAPEDGEAPAAFGA
jgi:hypothetical protein